MASDQLNLTKWIPLLSKEMPNIMYMLRLCNGKIYIGSTTDFLSRMKQHTSQVGFGARMTRKNIPVEVARIECFKSYSAAKKEALIAQDIPKLSSLAVPYWRKNKNNSNQCGVSVEDPE